MLPGRFTQGTAFRGFAAIEFAEKNEAERPPFGYSQLYMEPTLNEKINDLRLSIQNIDGLSAARREQMLQSLSEVESAVPAADDSHLPPLQQLEDSMLELEAKHPDATQLLKSVADALGRMGL